MCHPEKIRELPKFKTYKRLMYSLDRKETKNKKEIRKKLKTGGFEEAGIFKVPSICDTRCCYFKVCRKELLEALKLRK
jgi:hypothetical protein